MTIATTTGRIQYSGNDSTTAFATNFKLLDETHVKVLLDDTEQTLTTHYTVSGVGNSTATVTMITAPATGETLTLVLNPPFTQTTDLVNGQALNADTLENSYDLGTQVDQLLSQRTDRALLAPESVSTSFDGELPSVTANYVLRVNATADGFEAADASDVLTGASLTPTDGYFIVGTGTTFETVSPASARTELGLGTMALQNSASVAVTGGTVSGLSSLAVSGSITVTGTVDGVDVGALKTDVDGFPDELKNLTAGEIGELENIGTTTISAAQWGFLGAMTGTPLGNIVEDTTPQLGGSLDVNGQPIVSTSNGDITITPNGTGSVVLDGSSWPQTTGTNGYILETDGAGQLSWVVNTGGGISNVVEDTTPQLGGQLDVNGNALGDGTNELLTFSETASAVNHLEVVNNATASGPILRARGDDTNVDLQLDTKATGSIIFNTNGSLRGSISASGIQMGGSGAVISTFLDEDAMTSNSATALATQQSIKAYVDANSGITDVVSDTTPQLGGNLDVNGNSIISVANGDITIAPSGTGSVVLDGLNWPQADGTVNYVLQTDGAGQLSWAENTGGISNVVDDITPQLGGQLDANGNAIGDGIREILTFSEAASAVNHVDILNAATGNGPWVRSVGDDTNVDLNIDAKGTGDLVLRTASLERGRISSSGLQLGGAGAIVSEIKDEDNMVSDSATSLATQQSIKAYTDTQVATKIGDVVDDTTPQLGGQLDVNGNAIGDGTRELLTFTEDASAVNHVNIENEATGSGPIIRSAGDDTNVDLNIDTKGTGQIDFRTGGSSRGNINASGLQLGGSGARVTTVLDEDAMTTNSATALATQQSIKAYVDSKSSAITLLSTATPSSASEVTFTGLDGSSYSKYVIVFTQVRPATDNVYLQLQTSTDNGTSYASGSNDYRFANVTRDNSDNSYSDQNGHTDIGLIRSNGAFGNVGSATGEGINGSVDLFLSDGTIGERTNTSGQFSWGIAGGGDIAVGCHSGQRLDDTAVDAVRIFFSSGNISSGTIKLYGIT